MALRRNIYYSVISQWGSVGLTFLTTIFVSRLLTPREVGIFSISFIMVGLLRTMQGFGSEQFIVQKITLDTDTRRTAFGVSILAGVAVSILIVLASGPVSRFYDAPEIQLVMWILAVNPLLNMMASPIRAMFSRERMFHKLSVINVMSGVVSTATAVTLAFFGFAYFSLAIALVAGTATGVGLQHIMGSQFHLWRPGFAGIRPIFSFGIKAYLAQVFSFIQFQTTELIIGKALGLPAAAMFHRANVVQKMFTTLVTRSLGPVLTAEYASLNRTTGSGSVGSVFLSSIGYLSALAWPFFGFMALYGQEMILVLFGRQWTDAVLPMQILCIGAALRPMTGPASSVLVGMGAVGLNLAIRTVTVTVRLSLVIAAALYFQSLQAIAAAAVVSAGVTFILTTWGVHHKAPFGVKEFARGLAPCAIVALLALAPAAAVQWLLHDSGLSHFVMLPLGGIAAGLGWLAGLRVTKHPFWGEAVLLLRRVAEALLPAHRRAALPGVKLQGSEVGTSE